MSPHRATLRYDIACWLADGSPKDPRPYRLHQPKEFEFRLCEEGDRGLGAALRVWSAELKGLTKLMKRIRVAWQVRECCAVEAMVSG